MATDAARSKRKLRIRKKVEGTSERPRLTVFRSSKHIYAQVINDFTGQTLASACTLTKDVKGIAAEQAKGDAAKTVGKAIAEVCATKGISKVVFDRNGYIYHGRVKALADAARAAGLSF